MQVRPQKFRPFLDDGITKRHCAQCLAVMLGSLALCCATYFGYDALMNMISD